MIYLDHNATSPLLPEVGEAMRPWWGVPANPSSIHAPGRRATMAVERARAQVAELIGGDPAGVVFTSGATEANHLFLRSFPGAGGVAVGPLEHPSVGAAAEALGRAGFALTTWEAGGDGRTRVGAVPAAGLVSLMVANHETGVLQPIDEALAAGRRAGALVHTDATQAAGRIPLALGDLDGVTLSAHKLGGPPGVGALVLGRGVELARPLLGGGSQQRGRRAGTLPVVLAVGMGAACDLASREVAARADRLAALRASLEEGLRAAGARVVGATAPRLPNTTCVVFEGLSGESLVQALDLVGIAVSSGAACASGSTEPSPVLRAMGDPAPAGAVRFSLGPRTEQADVVAVLAALPAVLAAHRAAAGA